MRRVELLMYMVLGLVQGLTEFLPVSSSGHLVLAEHWLNFNPPGVLLEITVHMATLLAVILVYWRDLTQTILRRDWRFIGLIMLATAITVAMILPFRDFFEGLTEHPQAVRIIGVELLITAVWLAIADFKLLRGYVSRPASVKEATAIGIAQGISAFPGISRSGATIGAGILMNMERQDAARFSFILSIPVIFGAGILTIPDLAPALASGKANGPGLAIAFIASLVSGIAAIYLLLWLLRKARLLYFSAYCALLGIVALVVG